LIMHRMIMGLIIMVTCLTGMTKGGSATGAEIITSAHKSCGDCHLRGAKLKDMPLNDLCLQCHPANINDHKLGVIPKLLPKGLPLDKENRITCVTCHEPHGRGTTTKLLRLEHNSLCVACHPV
jgi:predicted CXXCH cytochrome family protein